MSKVYVEECTLKEAPLVDPSPQAKRLFKCDFEITSRCNNDCSHCYINTHSQASPAKNKELTAERIGEIAAEAASMGALFSTISGGEPLLRSDFSDIYLKLREEGLLITLMTNATLVTEEHVRLFKKHPPRDIEVTVYGVTESTYEAVTRRPGTYRQFMRGLNLLLDAGIKVKLKAMALRSNVHELVKISEFCRARTTGHFRFDPWLCLRYDGDPARNEEIKSERLSSKEFVAAEAGDSERYEVLVKSCDRMIAHKERSQPDCGKLLFGCGAGNGECLITSDGFFQLCSSLQHPECRCDLSSGNLKQAYESIVPKVRGLRSRSEEFAERCGSCSIINFCMWCPAHAYLETGELDKPIDYFCEVAHARMAAIAKP